MKTLLSILCFLSTLTCTAQQPDSLFSDYETTVKSYLLTHFSDTILLLHRHDYVPAPGCDYQDGGPVLTWNAFKLNGHKSADESRLYYIDTIFNDNPTTLLEYLLAKIDCKIDSFYPFKNSNTTFVVTGYADDNWEQFWIEKSLNGNRATLCVPLYSYTLNYPFVKYTNSLLVLGYSNGTFSVDKVVVVNSDKYAMVQLPEGRNSH